MRRSYHSANRFYSRLEQLESRLLLTCIHGDLRQLGDTLNIGGTEQADAYFITDDGAGNVTVDCSIEPTDPHEFAGVERIVARTRAGADILDYRLVNPLSYENRPVKAHEDPIGPADLNIRTGSGPDTVEIRNAGYVYDDLNRLTSSIDLHTGGADDSIYMDLGFPVQMNVDINARLGSGADDFRAQMSGGVPDGSQFSLDVDGQAGADTLNVQANGVFTYNPTSTHLNGGLGDDFISMDVRNARFEGPANFALIGGPGNNELHAVFQETEFADTLEIRQDDVVVSASVTDALGNITAYEYDDAGNLTSATSPTLDMDVTGRRDASSSGGIFEIIVTVNDYDGGPILNDELARGLDVTLNVTAPERLNLTSEEGDNSDQRSSLIVEMNLDDGDNQVSVSAVEFDDVDLDLVSGAGNDVVNGGILLHAFSVNVFDTPGTPNPDELRGEVAIDVQAGAGDNDINIDVGLVPPEPTPQPVVAMEYLVLANIDALGGSDDIHFGLSGLPETDSPGTLPILPIALGGVPNFIVVDAGSGENEVFVEFENVEVHGDHTVNLSGGRDHDRLQAEFINVHSFGSFEHILNGGNGAPDDRGFVYDDYTADGDSTAFGGWHAPGESDLGRPIFFVLHRDVELMIPVTANLGGSGANDLLIQTFEGGAIKADHVVNTNTGRGNDTVVHLECNVLATADNTLNFETGAGEDSFLFADGFESLDEAARRGGPEMLLVAAQVRDAFERLGLDMSFIDGTANSGESSNSSATAPSNFESAPTRTLNVDLGRHDDTAFLGFHDNVIDGNTVVNINAGDGEDAVGMRYDGTQITNTGSLDQTVNGDRGDDEIVLTMIDWGGAGRSSTEINGNGGDDFLGVITGGGVVGGSLHETFVNGGHGNDTVTYKPLFAFLVVDLDSRVNVTLEGGLGDDTIVAQINIAPKSTGSLSIESLGGKDDDTISLEVFAPLSLSSLFALLDGGQGIDGCFATDNVDVRNCEF